MFMPDIYWLDGSKTKQFLEMLVDDLLTEYSLTEGASKANGFEAGGNIQKLLAKYKADKSESIQREGTITRSSAALMKDLYTILDENGSIQHLDGFDDDIVSQLRNGEFVELEGEVTQSPAQLVFSSIMDFADQHKQLFITDEDENKQFEMASTMLKFKKVTLLIKPFVDSDYTFFTSIDTKNFVQDKYDLDGEFSVLARVRKVYKPQQSVDLIKMLPGKLKIGKKQMLDMLSGLKLAGDDISFDVDEIDESSFEINGPAIELTPIAIYQK